MEMNICRAMFILTFLSAISSCLLYLHVVRSFPPPPSRSVKVRGWNKRWTKYEETTSSITVTISNKSVKVVLPIPPKKLTSNVTTSKNDFLKERCRPPSLKPVHEGVRYYLRKRLKPLKCIRKRKRNATKTNTFSTNRYYEWPAFRVQGRYLHRINDVGVPCCVKLIGNIEEFDYINTSSIACLPLKEDKDVLEVEAGIDYVAVLCQNKTGYVVYMDAFHMIYKKKNPMPPQSVEHLNVLMIGIDASSQLNFIRTMPLSYEFLIRNLSGILLKGYNIVGECTHSNLIPLLTGQSAARFRETCAQPKQLKLKPVKLDNCSLIWNKFAQKGYLTSLAEDYPKWSPFFYYYPNCFEKSPTHYYLNPVAQILDEYYPRDYRCLGPKPSFEVITEFLQAIAELNEGPLFQLAFTGGLAYDNMNEQRRGDKILLSLLQNLYDKKILSNTALFIFGDHGFRKLMFQHTKTGGIELRMPIGLMYLPQRFRARYPHYYSNLVQNSQKMISHYDIHKTLLHILNLEDMPRVTEERASSSSSEPGTSLFLPIDKDRTCLSAGIPLHWCLQCHPINKNRNHNYKLKLEIADFMLEMLRSWNHLCDPRYIDIDRADRLTFKSISKLSKWDYRDVQRELCSSNGEGVVLPGYFGQSSLTLNIPCERSLRNDKLVEIIQIAIKTSQGQYEFAAEFVRYRNESNGQYYLHLTEDIRYIV